jgi:hypothetical protein
MCCLNAYLKGNMLYYEKLSIKLKKHSKFKHFHTLSLKFIYNFCMKTSNQKRILGGER